MEIGLSTFVLYNKSIFEALSFISKSGFKYVEIMVDGNNCQHFDYNNKEIVEKLIRCVEELNLTVVSLHPPFYENFDIAHQDENERKRTVQVMSQCLQILKLLKGRTMIIHPTSTNFKGKTFDEVEKERETKFVQATKSLLELVDLSTSLGLQLAIENMIPPQFGSDVDTLYKLKDKIGSKNVGFCFDSSHANLSSNPYQILRELLPHVIALHMSDNYGKNDDHLIPVDGMIDWSQIIKILNESSYKEVFMLEIAQSSLSQDILSSLSGIYQRINDIVKPR